MVNFNIPQNSILSLFLLAYGVNGMQEVRKPVEETKAVQDIKPWYRTVYGSEVEVVTPTVVGGVIFSAKPNPEETLRPWVSLNKEGEPKYITPEIKNGRTKRAPPDYKTYFKTESIRTLGYEDLKAKNMDPNDVFEEEVWVDEDDTYTSLNPVIRCTPERYFHKGLAKDVLSTPFCTPREDVDWLVGSTYFITWYTQFFRDEETDEVAPEARIHLSYIKESPKDVRYRKRDHIEDPELDEDNEETQLTKRGLPAATFFVSEWIDNVDGLYAIEPQEDWLGGKYNRAILISVQPSTVSDEEFDPLDHGVMVRMRLGPTVVKQDKVQNAMRDAGLTGEKWYYICMAIPTAVVIALFCMYFFLHLTRGSRDFSDVTRKSINKKRKVLGSLKDMKYGQEKNRAYNELPVYNKGPKHA